ncbi:Metal-dependent hydrolase, endonuclease/exonuclease/phosphatase family [Georgenia satyanarayanai]|uniref:Metal-dependent hydrolase, endonuclease/exonuclease/phosphatase family n=1 Tax=Georgenia satyanarayanai TaxID=860221 RepID=A0A2Y9AKV9_9MICO|nr:endonuclease/exonuclease/phosphatase family protein [Georgenia satyanarayanai]PYF98436.1 endonuclease/exonuclease/phosphatase family metal-dependent hydrolase [Georgenia satyanarayanai]SSA45101.1 Metal-dependent hydrolase, endonuclease/exonuclease/phosphatase family [Georgenia satyanarayanai]
MLVVTSNIQHGHPLVGDPSSAERLATAFRDLPGDLLALQEVDKGQARSGRIDETAVIAESLGYRWHRFAAAFAGSTRGLRRRPEPSDVPDDSGYGVALLSRWPVSSWHVRPLRPGPVRIAPADTRLGFQVRLDQPRVLLAAVVQAPSGPVTVGCTHLSVAPPVARRQLAESAWALRALPGPHLLLGDLNMGPDDAARVTGMRGLAHAPTFSARRPRRQLDHVLAGPGLRAVSGASTVRLPVSDHLALAVDVEPA